MLPELIATYRVQLRPDFGFEQAKDLISYLSDLGVSHLYTSPYLQAEKGSTHGYDVIDPGCVNKELGGDGAHEGMCKTLINNNMGHVIDVVPNHMAIASRQNPWWWDVLENGPSSRYATYFDVDWESSDERWPNKILLPVLGDHYGRILEDGQLQLRHQSGVFTLNYHEHTFPIDPSSLSGLLHRVAQTCQSEILGFLAESHARIPRPTVTARQFVERRHRDKAVLASMLSTLCQETPEIENAINEEIARINLSPDALDELIEQQNYRLALWRMANQDLGYRRFFDIKDLAGLRVEEMEVFQAIHALPIKFIRRGWAQGLRIDHPDGLRYPTSYFKHLRQACPDAWIVAEKILEPNEKLPENWPIDGTTGYDFLNLVGGLFVDPEAEDAFSQIYESFSENQTPYMEQVCNNKQLVLTELLGSELNRLTSLFVRICEQYRRHRDYSRHELFTALCETAVHFPVYRSYTSRSEDALRPEDEAHIQEAIAGARQNQTDVDPELFEFLKELLLLRVNSTLANELAMRFQQLTGPAMAKGVEDTTFYRYNRLISLNEVGGDPTRFGIRIADFHQACLDAQMLHPLSMNSTSTHDTKRSEDVRTRLALLTEIPERWADAVHRWASHNEPYRKNGWPEKNTEYLLYQTLVGAWPIDEERLTAYMEKAVRESKAHTSWTKQNDDYERAIRYFVTAIMHDREFLSDVARFVAPLIHPGRINSLSQTLIKLTAPGIPDIYQGTELWDLSLVDPDNRRLVDFEKRKALLQSLPTLPPEAIMECMDEGLPKLWTIRQTLHFRRNQPECFAPESTYTPLYAKGSKSDHVLAFMRANTAITLAPRLFKLLDDHWEDTTITLPEGNWRNILTGDRLSGGGTFIGSCFSRFPVALFVREENLND